MKARRLGSCCGGPISRPAPLLWALGEAELTAAEGWGGGKWLSLLRVARKQGREELEERAGGWVGLPSSPPWPTPSNEAPPAVSIAPAMPSNSDLINGLFIDKVRAFMSQLPLSSAPEQSYRGEEPLHDSFKALNNEIRIWWHCKSYGRNHSQGSMTGVLLLNSILLCP